MDSESIALILAIIAFIAVIIYIFYSLNIIPIPAPTPTPTPTFFPTPTPVYTPTPTPTPVYTPTPTPTLASVTVTYYSLSGSISTITLPQQSGTTIEIQQGASLVFFGTAQPNQTVTVYIYAPNGQVVYQQSAVAGINGQFSMTVPSSNATPGVTFLVTLNLGSNYYFYVTVVAPSQLPSSTPIIQPGYGNILISYTNGSISLPQQSGTTITVPQNSSLNINGQFNPNQQVFVGIYAFPQGQIVYSSTVTTNSNGYFEFIIPINNLTSGQKYLVSFNPCVQYSSAQACPFSNYQYYFYLYVS
jgi:hypothetical protein